ITKKKDTPLSTTIMFSVIFGVIIVGFVYAGLSGNTKSILDTIGGYVSPFGALITGIMIVCMFMPRVNDNGVFVGSIIAAIATFITQNNMPAHWLWTYFYGAVYCIVFSYIFSLFFKNESKEKRQYTIMGVKERLGDTKDEDGTPVAPLVFDKYGWIIVGIFVVQCIILLLLQL
ncbi:hypothetical protein, partial [Clostridium sediminicola]|uniref:hypothetical protein n=1 Tax=Clostridium sediminicola TaxID=3114879 RepID=UPI003D1683FF